MHRIVVGVSLALLGAMTVACTAESSRSIAVGGSALASSSPSQGASQGPPDLTHTFTSPLMGYTVDYPDGWTPEVATELWVAGASNYWDDPVGDRIESVAAGFRGTSQALAEGQTADQWLEDYLASAPTDCGEREQVVVDGQTATIDLNGCKGLGRLGGRVFDLVVIAGDRGYNFTMEGDVDHALLLAMLATVSLDPAGAKASTSP